MMEQEMLTPRERAANALGAAMLAAIELTVRDYMLPGQGGSSLPAAEQQSGERGEERNENFDLARFYRLKEGGAAAAEEAGTEDIRAAHGTLVSALHTERGSLPRGEWQEMAMLDVAADNMEDISERFERDARRYDGRFRVYE